MRTLNKVILVGNLTRDPEMRKTTNEQYVTTFGLATNRDWVTKDGRREQSAEFHELVCWGRLAEIASTRLKKGNLVYTEGHLKTRSWDDETGTKKFRTEIVIEDLIILEKKPRDPSASSEESSDSFSSEPLGSSQPSITVENPYTI